MLQTKKNHKRPSSWTAPGTGPLGKASVSGCPIVPGNWTWQEKMLENPDFVFDKFPVGL